MHWILAIPSNIKSKLAFEKFAAMHAVYTKHYHADNGRFKDNLIMTSEKRIGDLQRKVTTLLLHAQRRWPDAIKTHLWTYAIRSANDSRKYMHPQMNMTDVPCLDFVQPAVYQQSSINTILDAQSTEYQEMAG
jgi:hypothetical protein